MKKYIPIIIAEVYLFITLILYQFGPVEFNYENSFKLYGFVIIYQIMLFIGYIIAEKKIIVSDNSKLNKFKEYIDENFNKFMTILLCVAIIFSTIILIRQANTLNIIGILEKIYNSILNPEDGYTNNLQSDAGKLFGGRIFTTLSTIFAWFYYLAIPVGLYYFQKLSKLNKGLLVTDIILEILDFVVKGTNFGIFKVALIIIVVMLIKKMPDIKQGISNLKDKKNMKLIITIIAIIILVMTYFMYSTTNRMGGISNLPNAIYSCKIEKDNWLIKFIPKNVQFGIVMAVTYISQGYQGMAYAFDYDFNSTWGIGNSTFLTENFKDVLGINVYNNTYQYKMQDEWHPTINWHTAYTWWANDVGFVGVIFIMLIIGIMFNLVLRTALKGDIIAIVLLPLYILMLLFLPANNIVLGNPLTFMQFAVLNIVWIASKKMKIGGKSE